MAITVMEHGYLAVASFEELKDLEKDFEDVESKIIRHQVALTKPLYEKREKLIAKISHFWQLVFEQAPQDIDQCILPTDSDVLLSSLTSLSVSRFEIENGGNGDPRSVSIKMEFSENEWFEDKVLEKKFWYRMSKDGTDALVSEPVPIKWKSADKDLTQGMLDLVIKVWEQDKKQPNSDSTKLKKVEDYTPDEKALKAEIEVKGLGCLSFFSWFGFRGLNISAEESRLAIEEEQKQRADRANGKVPTSILPAIEEGDPLALEIFPEGETIAIAISEDLWPNAVKFFRSRQQRYGL
ncbi:nucleosome assembly protein [Hypoxylon sp. NC1633]|nr:nucleosome assembly protein [Hypoxylon sp. NC1633]